VRNGDFVVDISVELGISSDERGAIFIDAVGERGSSEKLFQSLSKPSRKAGDDLLWSQ
jgi:hypothetical protein